jgi:hypothetical protein
MAPILAMLVGTVSLETFSQKCNIKRRGIMFPCDVF